MTTDALLDVLQQLGVKNTQVANGNIRASCPWGHLHDKGSDNKRSWGMSTTEPHKHGCFACGSKGNLATFLMQRGFKQEKAYLMAGLVPQSAQDVLITFNPLRKTSFSVPELPQELIYPYILSDTALEYLKTRHISKETAEKCRLLYDHADNRVLFPWFIHDKFVGATGRSLVDDPDIPKTMPYFDMQKGEVLYFPSPKIRTHLPLIIVEGEIDAIRVFEATKKHEVCACGFGQFTAKHQALVLNLGFSKVFSFTDNDYTGDLLKGYIQKRFAGKVSVGNVPYVIDRKDPALMNDRQIRYCLSNVAFFNM